MSVWPSIKTLRASGHSWQNHRVLMDSLAKKLNITDQEAWYKVTWSTLSQNGVDKLLQLYNESPTRLITSVYPEYR